MTASVRLSLSEEEDFFKSRNRKLSFTIQLTLPLLADVVAALQWR